MKSCFLPGAFKPGRAALAVEVDLVAEALELVDGQVVAEDLEEMVAPAAHVEARPAVEVEAEPLLGRQDDVAKGLGREGHGQVVRPGEILGRRQPFLGPAEVEVFDELIGDDAEELADEIRPLLDRQEDLRLPHEVAGDAEGTVGRVGQGRVRPRIEDLAAEEADRVFPGHGDHVLPVGGLAGVQARADEVHALEAPEVSVR